MPFYFNTLYNDYIVFAKTQTSYKSLYKVCPCNYFNLLGGNGSYALFGAVNFGYRTFLFWSKFMYSCTFIGHADCDESIKENLYLAIEKLINEYNVTVFYVGTHGKFDYYAYAVLKELEKFYKIEIFVVLSNLTHVPEYIKGAKTVFPDIVAKSPYKYAIIKRNRYMIEKSAFLICYINHTFSNTYNFVKFAISKNTHIINLGGLDINKI